MLHIDFGADTSIGGGMLLNFAGPITFTGFTPSAFFNTLDTAPTNDTDFTGFGGTNKPASADFEIHLGSFTGISGSNDLGTLVFNTGDTGLGTITLSASPDANFGGFLDLVGTPLATTFVNGEINVAAATVPLPATTWLFATAFGLAGAWRRRRA